MDDEWNCDGSVFQMVGAATWKLHQPSCVLVIETSMIAQMHPDEGSGLF